MKTKEQLQKELGAIRKDLSVIESREWHEEHAKFVGTYWRYRNNYSCPEKPSDYWWLYRKVIGVSFSGRHLITFEFQTDKYGNHQIETNKCAYNSQGWQQCTKGQYRAAWDRLRKKLDQVRP